MYYVSDLFSKVRAKKEKGRDKWIFFFFIFFLSRNLFHDKEEGNIFTAMWNACC